MNIHDLSFSGYRVGEGANHSIDGLVKAVQPECVNDEASCVETWYVVP